MAAVTMATTDGVSVVLYYVLKPIMAESERIAGMPAQVPETRLEKTMALSKTLGSTFSETLGKWRPGHLPFGIGFLMRTLKNLRVEGVHARSGSIELKGPKIIAELTSLLRLSRLYGILFSEKEKSSPVSLESVKYSQEDVLFKNPVAELVKPVFTIICDKNLKCILLLIRGTHSIKDMLTAASCAVEPFHPLVVNDGGTSSLVKGSAHRGMVAAARQIAELSTPYLQKALREYPDYNAKIVGHSLGGGTAALLTFILREQKEFSSITCVAFAPAACMTWDLAESGKHFITTVINGSDFVPTFSTASIDNLRSEIISSPWLKDVLGQAERIKVKKACRRSKAALRSFLRPASSSTQSSKEDVTKAKLWAELGRELQSREEDEAVVEAQLDAAENKQASSSSKATTKRHQFYPPGRIMHIVKEEHDVRIYETPRELYNKIPLSRTMVEDHYMDKYKKMMELYIKERNWPENDDACSSLVVLCEIK